MNSDFGCKPYKIYKYPCNSIECHIYKVFFLISICIVLKKLLIG